MAGVNKQILLGNLGSDPEIRHMDNGRAVATFSLATNEVYTNKQGEKVSTTEWHNIVAWTPYAEIIEKYVKKSHRIYIEGKTTHRSYQSDGITKYITEVVVRSMTLLNNGGGGHPAPPDPQEARAAHVDQSSGEVIPAEIVDEEVDDLPF